MGNEMGNRNINGLQVAEQENNETTEVIDHSPNTSFLSLNGLDGLKGVTDYLAESLQTSEKHETENSAAGGFSEPSLAFDDVGDQSRLNSSRENEASEKEDTELLASNESSTSSLISDKKPTDLASIESLQEDGNLIQRTLPVGQVSDEERDEVNKESAKALTVMNNEDGIEDFPHHLPDSPLEKQGVKKVDADKSLENLAASNETDDKIGLTSSTEDQDSPDKLYNSAHIESCKALVQKQTLDNRGSDRDSENQEPKENTANMSSEPSDVSNDAEDSLHSISSTDLHDVHEKLSDPAQSESDESLILNQIFEERASEKHETQNLAAGDFSEPSLAFDDVRDQCQLNSLRENEEKDKEDTELLDSNESSTTSLISNKKPTDLASIESLQEDGILIHRTIPVGQVSDEECDEVNKESAKALTVLNDEDGIEGFHHDLPDCLPEKQGVKKVDTDKSLEILAASNETDDKIGLISSTEDHDSLDKLYNSAHSESCKALVQKETLDNRERDSENEEPKENTANMSSEHSDVSNDAENSLQSIFSTDLHDVHEKLSDPAQSESDESLILNRIFEEIGSEMDSENQDLKEKTANKSLEHSAVSNDAEDPTHLISSTDNHDLHEKLGDSAGSESDESLIQQQFFEQREEKDAVPWVQGTSGKCNELQDEKLERGTCGATVSMDSKISEGYTQQQEEGQQHCADTYRSEKGCAASKWEEEEEMPHESVSAAHLHAIDDDINILLRTNDLDEVGRRSKSEPKDEATSEEEPQMEDIENDSFDIQLNGVGPCTGGRDQEQEDAGMEDAMFELAIRTGYSPVLTISKEHEEDPVEEANGVEMGSSTLLQVVTQDEERIECGSNKSSEFENGTENSGDAEINGDENEEESECTNGEVNGHAEVVADELIDQTIAAANTAVTPTPPLLFEEVVVQKCTAEALLANKEELFTIDILRGNPSENEKQVQDPEATETVKCVTYEYERSDPEAEESTLNYTSKTEESKQDPPLISREARKNKRSEVSATEENVREYRVSTSHEDIGKLSDRSPLLRQRKSEDGRVSAEETDSEKPRTPFLNFLKEEVGVKEPVEKEGLLQKKAVKESKKSTTTSSISREKQKPRSSLFSSCMCCTTAIN